MVHPRRSAEQLSTDQPISTTKLEATVDVRRSALELLLKILEVDGAVRRVSGGRLATGQPRHYNAERYSRILQLRRDEQQATLPCCRSTTRWSPAGP